MDEQPTPNDRSEQDDKSDNGHIIGMTDPSRNPIIVPPITNSDATMGPEYDVGHGKCGGFRDWSGNPLDATTPPSAPRQTPSHGTPRKPLSGLALAGMVLGIISLLFCWIMLVNILSIVLGITGVGISVAAILQTGRKNKRRGRGMAIAGAVTSALAVIISAICIPSQIRYLSDSITQALSTDTQIQQPVEKNNLTACEKLMGDDFQTMLDIPDVLLSIGSTTTQEQQNKLLEIHSKISDARQYAESDLDGQLASLDIPFQQAYDTLSSGGGQVTMDTSHVAADVTNIVQTCAAAGYQIKDDSVLNEWTDTSVNPESETEPEPDVPIEYQNALTKAERYSNNMHMSRQGIYDQLTSEYGEKFSPEAAQYAIDNLHADYNANALEKAKSYQERMAMSPSAIYDQLVSEYGEQFTPEEAQYAIDHLNQ